ncbi:MAG: hypothetical protein COA42_05845 [Alteromonadaceae bacterium]|nr:MAG: hypothetical protein COA42_05845 [Alteromonadaceae bacterium]
MPNPKIFDLTPPDLSDYIAYPILIVSHDAGGASVLAAWVERHLDVGQCDFLLEGPALRYFSGLKIEDSQRHSRTSLVPSEVSRFACVITSTSGEDVSLEREYIQQCRLLAVKVLSMLDHWVNYVPRFCIDGRLCWPDLLMVNDVYAQQLLVAIPGAPPSLLFDNYYLQQQVAQVLQYRKSSALESTQILSRRILYVSEPSTDSRYNEFELLERFLNSIFNYDYFNTQQLQVRVRLHPREKLGKYDELMFHTFSEYSINYCKNELYHSLAWSNTVVGAQTTPMVIALYAGIEVYSCLPEVVEKMTLPFDKIRRIY